MSINENQKTYKIEHKKIKLLSTQNLKRHIDKVKSIKRDFFVYNIEDLSLNEEYLAIKRYVFFLNKEFISRPDYKNVIDEIEAKRTIDKSFRGCNHLKKGKRKNT